MANQEWISLFLSSQVNHLSASVSDHSPIIVQLNRHVPDNKMRRRFRFEQMWLNHEDCANIIKNSWNNVVEPDTIKNIKGKLSNTA